MQREVDAIINPVAGNGKAARIWPRVERQLSGHQIQAHEHRTARAGEAAEIARRLRDEGRDDIVVVGGDGTVNETVNGLLAGDPALARETVISVIPCGTGRDFSRSIGIRSIDQAIVTAIDGKVRAIDVALARFATPDGETSRYFVNVGDVGLGAETAAYINHHERYAKLLGGFLTYFIGAIRTIAVYQPRLATVRVDGKIIHQGPLEIAFLANGRFHAGGMDVAPWSSNSDGELDVLVLRRVPKLVLMGSLLPKVYRGLHVGHPAVVNARGETIEVDGPEPLAIEMDGEQPGTTTLTVTVAKRALNVRVPDKGDDLR
ncbi:MAG TPA: diacylglycerol kinase family protein [Thermomicrobiaceae bacterium]|nr:diacylglycerol kinase family protein [Thermomicrobiaceae bacterium]